MSTPWLIFIIMVAVTLLPWALLAIYDGIERFAQRLRARVMARNAAQAAWEAQLRADAAERAALRKLGLVVRGTEAAIDDAEAEAALDEAYAFIAASEALQIDREWEAQG